MNVTLTPEGYTLDGKWRLVPVEPSREMGMAVHKSRHSNTMYSEIFAIMVKAAPNPPQSLSPWQPIATAPKDKRIWLYRPTAPEWWRAMGGKYDNDEYAKNPKPYWSADNWSIGKLEQRQHTPTHWMPLPEPAP